MRSGIAAPSPRTGTGCSMKRWSAPSSRRCAVWPSGQLVASDHFSVDGSRRQASCLGRGRRATRPVGDRAATIRASHTDFSRSNAVDEMLQFMRKRERAAEFTEGALISRSYWMMDGPDSGSTLSRHLHNRPLQSWGMCRESDNRPPVTCRSPTFAVQWLFPYLSNKPAAPKRPNESSKATAGY